MPVMMCAYADDEHAPFPHRLVIPMITLRERSGVNGAMVTVVTLSDLVFVICAHCDHEARRVVTRCRCRERCHPNLSLSNRYQNPRFSAVFRLGLVLVSTTNRPTGGKRNGT